MNVPNKNRITELVSITENISDIENTLLVFRTNSTGRNQTYFDEVHAYLFNTNKLIETKTAYVADIGGTLFMHFEGEIE